MSTTEVSHPLPTSGICPTCQRPFSDLTPEEVEEKLIALEPVAFTLLEGQLGARDQRVAQAAAKMLLEWKRGKPNQTVNQKTDQITTIRYESAAWAPLPEELGTVEHVQPQIEESTS